MRFSLRCSRNFSLDFSVDLASCFGADFLGFDFGAVFFGLDFFSFDFFALDFKAAFLRRDFARAGTAFLVGFFFLGMAQVYHQRLAGFAQEIATRVRILAGCWWGWAGSNRRPRR